MDLYFQGMAWANRGVNPDYFGKARTYFERALALDPGNVDALVGTASSRRAAWCLASWPTTAPRASRRPKRL